MKSRTRQRAAGDVRYLTEARQALADLRDLFGLDASRTEILEVRQAKTLKIEFHKLMEQSDEELEQQATLARLVQRGEVRLIEVADAEGGSVENGEPASLSP